MNPSEDSAAASTTSETQQDSAAELRAYLEKAAELAVAQGWNAEMFSDAAASAHQSKNPSFREEQENRHLVAQLSVLRAQGRIAIA